MKKILLSLCAMLLAGASLAQTKTTIYAEVTKDDSGNRTLTFKATNGTPKYVENDDQTGTFQLEDLENTQRGPSYLYGDNGKYITKAVFEDSVQYARPKYTNSWFIFLENLKSIEGLDHLNTSEVTDMSSMFGSCSSLESLDLSNFDTKNVTNMGGMFSNCSSLTSIIFGKGFDTSKVTEMGGFYNCSSLTSLDLSGFDTHNITDMGFWFDGCSSLKTITFGKDFDTSNVTNMMRMFSGCSSLTSLDLSGFDTKKVGEMFSMFSGCSSLSSIKIGEGFIGSSVTRVSSMFNGCSSLTELDLSNFNPHFTKGNYEAPSLARLFSGCTNLVTLNLGTWDLTNVDDVSEMFKDCESLTTLNVTFTNTQGVQNMSGMYSGCLKLPAINLESFNTQNVTDMSYMFSGCTDLTDLKWGESFNTASVTNMSEMFYGCHSLSELSFPVNFNTSNVTDMHNMFGECYYLKTIDVSKFNTSNVTDMAGMFSMCGSLTSLDVKNFDTGKVTRMSYMFNQCYSLKAIDVSKFNTSNVTDISGMFSRCSGLSTLDVSNFKISNVTEAYHFLYYMGSLQELNVGANDFSTISDHDDVFTDVGYVQNYGTGIAYNPCRILYTFDISRLGEANTQFSINKELGDYNREIIPFHEYCGGVFTIADTLKCGDNTKYTPVDGTRPTDLWQYDRHMKKDQWNTMFVPVATTVAAIKKTNYIEDACEMESYDGTTLKFKSLDDSYTIPANTPILVKPQYDLVDLAYTTVTTEVPTNNMQVSTTPDANGYYATFYGSYEYGLKLDRSCYYYNIASGKFVRSHGNSYCDNTRGYFKFFKDGKEDTGEAKQFALDDGGVITSITAIDGEPVGQGSDKAYNLSGQRVGRDYKGIVIVGGRKVVRK